MLYELYFVSEHHLHTLGALAFAILNAESSDSRCHKHQLKSFLPQRQKKSRSLEGLVGLLA